MNMRKEPRVAIVILNWNGRFFLEKFLPSVFNSTYPNVEFILGDNASTDDSITFVEQHYPRIRVIRNSENLGFAGGYNAVLQEVDADYFMLLNSDVEVSPGWLEPLVAHLQKHPEVAAAQPKIRAFHDRTKFEHAGGSGGYIDWLGYPFCRGRIFEETEVDAGQYDETKHIFWATGAALLIRATCWRNAAGFDADFFAHMEEVDLCWRLQRMGYKIAVCPRAVVYHVGGGTLPVTNPRKTYLNFRNNLFMLQKNLPVLRAFIVIFIRLWLDLLALFRFAFKGEFANAWAISRAHRAFFRSIFRTAGKRDQKIPYTIVPAGIYQKSILWSYFAKKNKHFHSLRKSDFSSP